MAGAVAVGICIALAVSATPVGGQEGSRAAQLTATLVWAMPERFGMDSNGDKLVDYEDQAHLCYVHPESYHSGASCPARPWKAEFQAFASGGMGPYMFNWIIAGDLQCTANASIVNTTSGTFLPHSHLSCIFGRLGTYNLTLVVRDSQTFQFQLHEDVTLVDRLIVSIGDSYGSGEGSPDLPRYRVTCPLGDPGVCEAELVSKANSWQYVNRYCDLTKGPLECYVPPAWEDAKCHRSAWAGAPLAARNLERADPHSSVTFLHLACSGATVDEGLLDAYVGREPDGFSCMAAAGFGTCDDSGTTHLCMPSPGEPYAPCLHMVDPQVDQVARLTCGSWNGVYPYDSHGRVPLPCPVGQRIIDALLISIGGNDVGFGDLAAACAGADNCYDRRPNRGYPPELNGYFRAIRDLDDALSLLPSKYTTLAHAIDSKLQVERWDTYLTEYLDPLHDEIGGLCSAVTDVDSYSGFWADMAELYSEVDQEGITPDEAGWLYSNMFTPLSRQMYASARGLGWNYVGGIGALSWSHGTCANVPWIRGSWGDSVAQQDDKFGILHPNPLGYNNGYRPRIEFFLTERRPLPNTVMYSRSNGWGPYESTVAANGWLTGCRANLLPGEYADASSCFSSATWTELGFSDPNDHKGFGYPGFTFQEHSQFTIPAYSDAFGGGDFDGDGRLDVVTADEVTGVVHVYSWDGARWTLPLGSFNGGLTWGDELATGDVDGNGRDEVIIAGDGRGVLDIFGWNGQRWTYVTPSFWGDFTQGDGLTTGDFNGDGRDEVAISGDVSGIVDVFNWNGNVWTTSLGSFASDFNAHDAIASGDLDGNGRDEILVAGDKAGYVDVFTWSGYKWIRGPGAFWRFHSGFNGGDAFGTGDTDGNGRDEVMVLGDVAGIADLFQWDGAQWKRFPQTWVGFGGGALAVGDVNGGGLDELAVIDVANGRTILYGTPDSVTIDGQILEFRGLPQQDPGRLAPEFQRGCGQGGALVCNMAEAGPSPECGSSPGNCQEARWVFRISTSGVFHVVVRMMNTASHVQTYEFAIKVDLLAPTVVGVPKRPPDFAGWYNHPVLVEWLGFDEGSGIDSCTPPILYSGPASFEAVVYGACTDRVGRTTTGTKTIRYDGQAPETAIDGATDSNGEPVPNGGRVQRGGLAIFFSGSDNLASPRFVCLLDGQRLTPCTSPVRLNVAPGDHVFQVHTVDDAGNTDKTPPSFAWEVEGARPLPLGSAVVVLAFALAAGVATRRHGPDR